MRQPHEPGDMAYIDYAGETFRYYPDEEQQRAEIFVAGLGASELGYVEAAERQKQEDFLRSTERALRYFGGVPRALVPDYVPRHIIRVMFPFSLCGETGENPGNSWRNTGFWQHNVHSESSQLSSDSSSCHTAFRGLSAERGESRVNNASSFVRILISA